MPSPTLPVSALFGLSVAYSLAAWTIVARLYIWPALREQSQLGALRPLLVLHSFRFVGLGFLVPGVVSAQLPLAFASPAALGDLIAASLALLSLAASGKSFEAGLVWAFNLFGTADLFYAFYAAGANGLEAGRFQTTFYIPTLFVPLLLVTHGLIFIFLLRRTSVMRPAKVAAPLRSRGHRPG